MKIIITLFLSALLCACSFDRSQQAALNLAAAEINSQLALAYLSQQHDYPRAKQKLLLAQKQASQDPAVWYVTGYFFELTNEARAAEQAYLHAIALAPHSGPAHNNYGAFLCRQRRYTESVQQFLLAVSDPDYLAMASAYENAGRCALKIPNAVLAKQFFNLAKVGIAAS